MPLSEPNIIRHYFHIEYEKHSDVSTLIFTSHQITKQHVVMKILRRYKDTRYDFETVDKRQKYQLEAIRRNRVFAPTIYIGLAPLYEQLPNQVCIGEIIKEPSENDMEIGVEYALLMEQLPEDKCLVHLLNHIDVMEQERFAQILVLHIAHMHTDIGFLAQCSSREDDVPWGHSEQLRLKLEHNFELLDQMLEVGKGQYEAHISLKDILMSVFLKSQYLKYFDERLRGKHIKHCHGDLKAPNIWILPTDYQHNNEAFERILILDAIDFNSSYSNIDILSDFAMLVIDIQARLDSSQFADKMINYYLQLTNQRKESSISVLDYYLVEKAMVGAAVSIVYDRLPGLGYSYLRVAHMRAERLIQRLESMN